MRSGIAHLTFPLIAKAIWLHIHWFIDFYNKISFKKIYDFHKTSKIGHNLRKQSVSKIQVISKSSLTDIFNWRKKIFLLMIYAFHWLFFQKDLDNLTMKSDFGIVWRTVWKSMNGFLSKHLPLLIHVLKTPPPRSH